jgi:hypothetical protein
MRASSHAAGQARRAGRGGDEGRPTKQDETGRRVAPGDTPQHASELNQAPVVRDFLIVQMPDARYLGERPSLFAQGIASGRDPLAPSTT